MKACGSGENPKQRPHLQGRERGMLGDPEEAREWERDRPGREGQVTLEGGWRPVASGQRPDHVGQACPAHGPTQTRKLP